MKPKPKPSAARGPGPAISEPEPVIDRAEQEAWEDAGLFADMTESGRRWFLE